MTIRSDFARARPGFPVLAAGDVAGLVSFAAARDWLAPGEVVRTCDRAGEGNMNLTLRVETDRRSFILKQARPWVEKYDTIPAPIERAHFERAFYELAETLPGVAQRMPALLHADADACVIILEDLGDGTDLTSLYRGGSIDRAELDTLAHYLHSLHEGTRKSSFETGRGEGRIGDVALSNRGMRELNHEHIFVVPLEGDMDSSIGEMGAGLLDTARALRTDRGYRKVVRETSERYLGVESEIGRASSQLHGDYFPGSWLRSANGLRIIDPEFTFPGDREIDVGCLVAHFALARRSVDEVRHFQGRYESGDATPLDPKWLARYAGVEVMRRLIGVAQLPLPADRDGWRASLLLRSRQAMMSGELEALFA